MRHKTKNPPEEKLDLKNDDRQKREVPQPNNKPKVRKVKYWAIWLVLAAFLAQYIESFNHTLLYLSLVFVLFCFAIASIVHRGDAVNFGATHVQANQQAVGIFAVGLLVCGALFWWEYKQPREPTQADTFQAVRDLGVVVIGGLKGLKTAVNTTSNKYSELESKVRPRKLSQTQMQVMLNDLRSNTKTNQVIAFTFSTGEDEEREFAGTLMAVFAIAGFKIEVESAVNLVTPYPVGLTVSARGSPPSESLPALKEAFEAVSIEPTYITSVWPETAVFWARF
jgi:hypothetical protein